MSLTFTEARDEILTIVREAWITAYPSARLEYWDVPADTKAEPDTDPLWARVTVRHSVGQNDAISNRLFLRQGTVTTQLFTIFGNGLSDHDTAAKVIVDSLQGKQTPGGVWFRNVRLNEIGQDNEWFQSNVLADFEYTERI